MHGVSLSIGSADPLDGIYLDKLAELAARVNPVWISDHLCWTGVAGVNSHDLLPMPLTEASLAHVTARVRAVQDRLGRPLILENPSTYLRFKGAQMPEWEYLGRLAEDADCGLLLDVNNVFVSATNHGYAALDYLSDFPLAQVGEIHLAGHAEQSDDEGERLLIDSHDEPVADAVWKLYEIVISCCGPIPTLIEWDSKIPAWPILRAEAAAAQAILDRFTSARAVGSGHAA
jgi:uncharacterized protein (UPF0276 family)